jgi:hypothetical protein
LPGVSGTNTQSRSQTRLLLRIDVKSGVSSGSGQELEV